MERTVIRTVAFTPPVDVNQRDTCVGRIVALTEDGRPLVDFPGNPGSPVLARSILRQLDEDLDDHPHGLPVVLFFDRGDPGLPIILGRVRETIVPRAASDKRLDLDRRAVDDLTVDGKRLSFEAHQEIVLTCGDSSLVMRKDGKIVIRGTQIISRASRTHKIRGASVRIN